MQLLTAKQTDSPQQGENDYHAIDYEVQKPNISRQLYRSALPTSYDDRKQHEVTSIKNQNPYGDCWAFSAMAAAETNLLKRIQRQLIYQNCNLRIVFITA